MHSKLAVSASFKSTTIFRTLSSRNKDLPPAGNPAQALDMRMELEKEKSKKRRQPGLVETYWRQQSIKSLQPTLLKKYPTRERENIKAEFN